MDIKYRYGSKYSTQQQQNTHTSHYPEQIICQATVQVLTSQKPENISNIFYDHNGIKLETNNSRETGNFTNKPPSFIFQGTKKRAIQDQGCRRKEIIKIRAEISEIETRRIIEEINKTEICFFEKVNKIDKSLVRLIKTNREDKTANERKRRY